MTDINEIVMEALKDIDAGGVPVRWLTYSDGKPTYITFFEYHRQPEQNSDDGENIIGHYIQVDVFSKGDLRPIVDKVRAAMKAADFSHRGENEFYESDTKIYHKCLRYYYFQEV